MGDYGDYININDKRFNANTVAPWMRNHFDDLSRAQTKRFLEIMEPIADKCLALIEGNHERTQANHFERNVYYDICDGIKRCAGLPESDPIGLGYTGWLILSLPKARDGRLSQGSTTLRINCHHGSGGARTRFGRLAKLEQYANYIDADLVLVGHMHVADKIVIHYRSVKGQREVTRRRWAALTGTFLDMRNPDGYITYSEEKMYTPLPPSHMVIDWYPHRRDPCDILEMWEEH